MKKNKNALVRYKTNDKLLASRKGYTYNELVRACSEELQKESVSDVSVASIRKDVAAMKRIYGVQVETLGYRGHERPLAHSESFKTINGETLTDPNLIELQPYFLKCYNNNRWFLLFLCKNPWPESYSNRT